MIQLETRSGVNEVKIFDFCLKIDFWSILRSCKVVFNDVPVCNGARPRFAVTRTHAPVVADRCLKLWVWAIQYRVGHDPLLIFISTDLR